MPFARRLTTAFAVLLATAGSLAAQNAVQGPTVSDPPLQSAAAPAAAPAAEQAPVAASVPEQQPVSLAPFAENATVGIHAKSASDMPAPYVPPRADNHGQGVTMMIIGGAALVAGAIIGGSGGTVIAVAGVVVGAIGLYKFLQ